MEDIVEPTISHDFSTLCLGPPTTVAGGSYFTRIMHKNNKPLYVQTPKCFSKQGFVKSGKRIYSDLMFDNNDTIFIDWIEKLEAKCQELVYIKGEKWFQTKLEKDDIETAFTSPLKVYKSGKFYLLRINVKPNIKIYNESDKVVNLEEIVETNSLISILEIQGIKFTSRNFQIEIDLKQSLVVSPDPFLDACFIKKPVRPITNTNAVTNANANANERILDILKGSNDLPENENFDLETSEPIKEHESPKITELPKILETETKVPEITEQELNNLSLSLEEFDFDEDFDAKTAANTAANTGTIRDVSETPSKAVSETPRETVSETPRETVSETKNSVQLESFKPKNEAITLDIEDLNVPLSVELNTSLSDFTLPLDFSNDLETLTLKKPNQVYHEIYQKAREKAKAAKKEAMLAYLEVKNIKKTYMLDNMDDSDSESDIELELES
jgi:hypothetical protein